MVESRKNQIADGELCLVYSGYWRKWSRVLYMERDQLKMVELNLTPIDPSKTDNWVSEVFAMKIRVHQTRMDQGNGDRLYRCVQKNSRSVVYQEVRRALLREVPIEIVLRLLNEDFLSRIDWDLFVEAQQRPVYRGGGIPFALCKHSGLDR